MVSGVSCDFALSYCNNGGGLYGVFVTPAFHLLFTSGESLSNI